MRKVLDKFTLRSLSSLLEGCDRGARARWVTSNGDVADGVMRAFTDKDGCFIRGGTDVRDAHIWLSGTFELFMPVSEILDKMETGEFSVEH